MHQVLMRKALRGEQNIEDGHNGESAANPKKAGKKSKPPTATVKAMIGSIKRTTVCN